MEYAKLINIQTINALLEQAGQEKQAEFIENLKRIVLFINTANFSLVELLEEYAISTDSHCQQPRIEIFINALYTLKNNLQIERDLGEFLECHTAKTQEQQQ
ncbi:hypothetical protein ACN9OL_10345 [Glaesserella parasuis]|uniref:hypothetical protein n=1 Tax=Glaesserella parasuis TaxID=738 RepID=UPI003B66C906